MIIRHLRSGRRLAVVAIFAIVAVSAFGFAAQNTVDSSRAGDGSGDIEGFSVSEIHYELNATDASLIDGVEFTLSPAAGANATVKVQFNETGSWYDCTGTSSVSCDVSSGSVTVLAATKLRVVAAD